MTQSSSTLERWMIIWLSMTSCVLSLNPEFETDSPEDNYNHNHPISSGVQINCQKPLLLTETNLIRSLKILKPDPPLFIQRSSPNINPSEYMTFFETKIKEGFNRVTRRSSSIDRIHKREINPQTYNPMAYVGWLQSRIFGLTSTFDLDDLKVNSQKLTQYVTSLSKAVNSTQIILIDTVNHLKIIDQNMNLEIDGLHFILQQDHTILSNLTTFIQEDAEITHQMIFNLLNLIQYIDFQSSSRIDLMECSRGYITERYISQEELRKIIKSIESSLNNSDYQLTLSSRRVQAYYDLPLTFCIDEGDHILLFLSIPIYRPRIFNEICEIIPLPMTLEGQTCLINLPSTTYSITRDNQIRNIILRPYLQSSIDLHLILERIMIVPGSSDSSCVSALFTDSTVGFLQSVCSYSCSKGSSGLWTQLNETNWIYSGPMRNVTSYCQHNNGLISTMHLVGGRKISSQIYLSCSCFLQDGDLNYGNISPLCSEKIDPVIIPLRSILYLTYDDLIIPKMSGNLYFNMNFSNHSLDGLLPRWKLSNWSLIDEMMRSPSEEAPLIDWNSGYTSLITYIIYGIMIFLILTGLIWTWKRCRSPTQYIPAMSIIPGSDAESFFPIFSELIVDLIMILILVGFLIMIYRLVSMILVKLSCHHRSTVSFNPQNPHHLDLIIPYRNTPIIVALCSTNLPSSYYQSPQLFDSIEIVTMSDSSKLIIEGPATLRDVAGGSIDYSGSYVITKPLLPTYKGIGYIRAC